MIHGHTTAAIRATTTTDVVVVVVVGVGGTMITVVVEVEVDATTTVGTVTMTETGGTDAIMIDEGGTMIEDTNWLPSMQKHLRSMIRYALPL
jgi:hypothetical protein